MRNISKVKIEVHAGTQIVNAIDDAFYLAAMLDMSVELEFNDVKLTINQKDNITDKIHEFLNKSKEI